MRNPSKNTIKRMKSKGNFMTADFWQYNTYLHLAKMIKKLTKGKITIKVYSDLPF